MRQTMRAALLAAAANSVFAAPAGAVAFQLGDGWQVNLDTTVSAAVGLRTANIDYRYVGQANGGRHSLPNNDNGTLNFRNNKVTQAPMRITEELDIKRDDYGAFVRATMFYDPVYNGVTPDFRPYNRAQVRMLGFDMRLLDAFAYWNMRPFDHEISVRLGSQAINWGESIFLQGGINSASPFDANALLRPGAQLREAVLPRPSIDIRTSLTENLSLEAYYEFYWNRTRFPPSGTFFSTVDTLSDGGYYSVINRFYPDSPASIQQVNLGLNNAYGPVLLRGVDIHPNNQGQFGVALRYVAQWLDDAEFGVYFENYHSRTPFVAYQTGSAAAAQSNLLKILTGRGITYLSTARFRDDYPEDIRLLGASFSASLPGGFGLQGEVSHRFNQPILLSTPDALLRTVSPFLCGIATLSPVARDACRQANTNPTIAAAGGVPGYGQTLRMWKRFPVTQAQVSVTKLLPPVPSLGITNTSVVAEFGMNVIHDFPNEAGILDTPWATNVNSAFSQLGTVRGVLQKKGLATQVAGGGAMAVIIDMPDIVPWGVLTQPTIAWNSGFFGRNPLGAGQFQEGQNSVSVGVSFNYLQRLRVTMNYVNYFAIGPSRFYQLQDRDYVGISASYNF